MTVLPPYSEEDFKLSQQYHSTKQVYGMENWWIEEMPDGSDRLRGNIVGRSSFQSGEPVLNMEASYTSTILAYNDTTGARVETVNSYYLLGEPMSDEALEKQEEEFESLRAMMGEQ